MNKKQAILWICMFIGIIVALPLFMIATDDPGTDNQEYRELAEMPAFNFHGLDHWISQVEDYVNDHVPYRSRIIKAKSQAETRVFKASASDKVVMGTEGWMYLIESVDWYRGEKLYTDEELQIIIDKLLFLTNQMKSLGGEFILFIAPNKETIYPEYLPASIGAKNYNKTEQLIEALEENGIKYIFPVESLLDKKDSMQLYAKRDTHWNSLGAYIGAYELNQYMQTSIPPIDELGIYPKPFDGEDLARMMNLAGTSEPEEDYDFVGYAQGREFYMDSWDATGNSLWYLTDGAPNQKVYLLRDSFGHSMINFVVAGSSNVCVRHIDVFYPESIEEEAPTYFVLELVERRIDDILHMDFE